MTGYVYVCVEREFSEVEFKSWMGGGVYFVGVSSAKERERENERVMIYK